MDKIENSNYTHMMNTIMKNKIEEVSSPKFAKNDKNKIPDSADLIPIPSQSQIKEVKKDDKEKEKKECINSLNQFNPLTLFYTSMGYVYVDTKNYFKILKEENKENNEINLENIDSNNKENDTENKITTDECLISSVNEIKENIESIIEKNEKENEIEDSDFLRRNKLIKFKSKITNLYGTIPVSNHF